MMGFCLEEEGAPDFTRLKASKRLRSLQSGPHGEVKTGRLFSLVHHDVASNAD